MEQILNFFFNFSILLIFFFTLYWLIDLYIDRDERKAKRLAKKNKDKPLND